MPTYTASIEIAAPRETVFDLVADLVRHGEWSADPLQIVPAGANGYRATATSKGKTIEASITVIERAAPERFVFDVADTTGRWRHTFTLEEADRGTHVTRAIAGDLSGAQLALFWVVLLPIKKPNARRALERLKELAEGGSA